MKFLKISTLAIGAMLTLASCSGGPNLGKEVAKADFEKAWENAPEESSTNTLKIKFDYVYDGNVPGMTTAEYHADFTFNVETGKVSDLTKDQQLAIALAFTIDYDYVKDYWTSLGADYTCYMGENPTTFGIKANYDKSASSVTSKTTGTYQWNENTYLTYVDEVAEAKSGDQWLKQTTSFTCSYSVTNA